MKHPSRLRPPADGGKCAFLVATLAIVAWTPRTVLAQTTNPGLGLPGLAYANEVERVAAVANQAAFDALDASCNPGGALDTVPEPPAPPPGASCGADHFFVYLNARELVHTANEIRGSGASVASLGQDLEGLGKALRWTAAEELAVQGSMGTQFANGQLSNLAARLSALRFGAGGFSITNLYLLSPFDEPRFAQNQAGASSGADTAAGEGRESFSRWGGFLNGSFGYGTKQPTPLEDAFDFDGSELTLGVDYRFPSNLVLGGILGFSKQAVDFDEAASAISVVDGNVDSEGTSLILFAFLQSEHLSVSGSLGTQTLDYDIVRNIKYPSFNPDLGSTNSVANSHPSSDVTMATFSFGYAFGQRKLTVEPIFNLEYIDISVASFAEERSINRLSDAGESKRFDLDISHQAIQSLDASVGARLQYVFTPGFGVIVPYLSLESHRELKDDARIIVAGYAAIQDIVGVSSFAVPTDVPARDYAIASLGLSAVLRGGRQRELGGPIAGGLSAFVQLKSVRGRAYYDDRVVTGGFRYEF
jgi:uncharacterized protein YhjY with autotransporter beta-barrel domain